jgi:hypothetical protein
MESIDDDAEALDIFMVKLGSTEDAKRYGLYSLPAIVHFEDGVPNVYDEDMTKDAVMAWLTDQKTGAFIEKVTPALLQVSSLETIFCPFQLSANIFFRFNCMGQ